MMATQQYSEYYANYCNNFYPQFSNTCHTSTSYHGHHNQNYNNYYHSLDYNSYVNKESVQLSNVNHQPNYQCNNEQYKNESVNNSFVPVQCINNNSTIKTSGYQCESTVKMLNDQTTISTQKTIKQKVEEESPTLHALLTHPPKQKIKYNPAYFYQKLWSGTTITSNQSSNEQQKNFTPSSPTFYDESWYDNSFSPASFSSSTILPDLETVNSDGVIPANQKSNEKLKNIKPDTQLSKTTSDEIDGVVTPPLSPNLNSSLLEEKSAESSVTIDIQNYKWIQNGLLGKEKIMIVHIFKIYFISIGFKIY